MKLPLLSAFLICLAGLPAHSWGIGVGGAAQGTAPNVVIIVADDVGFGDIKWDDAANYLVPNLASLASEGTRFNRFYVTPVCSPTRAALLTGRSPIRWGQMSSVIYANSDVGTPRTEELLPEMLADLGYTARMTVGKWHLGNRFSKFHPIESGFTHFFGNYTSAVDYYTKNAGGQVDWRDGYDVVSPLTLTYQTDVIGAEAVNFINSHATEPFLLYVPFQAAHFPKQAPQNLIDHFTNNLGLGLVEATHLAMIASMDANIGLILDALDFNQIQDNTIVWFLSDNGGMTSQGASNDPLNGGKGQLTEGGLRVPSVLRYTGQVPAGNIVDHMVSHVDLVPTIREYIRRETGPLVPKLNDFDGRDMSDFIDGTGNASDLDGKEHFVLRDKRSDDAVAASQTLLSYEYVDSSSEHLWKLVWSGDFDQSGYVPGSTGDNVFLYDVYANEQDRPGFDDVINATVEADLVQRLAVWLALRPAGSGFPTVDPATYLYLPNWDFRDLRTDPIERYVIYKDNPSATTQEIGYLQAGGAIKVINNTANLPDGFDGLLLKGIGRSHRDGLLYGIDPNGTDPLGVNLYQVDGTEQVLPNMGFGGQVMRLGTIQGIPLGADITAGDVHPDGKSYFCYDQSAKALYEVELRNLVASRVAISGERLATKAIVNDLVFDSNGDILAMEERSHQVFKVAMQPDGSGILSFFPFLFPGLRQCGAAWVDASDNLLVYCQGGTPSKSPRVASPQSGLYQLNLSTGSVQLLSVGSVLYDADGAGTPVGP